MILFEGAAGAWLSLHVGNFAVNPAGATIAYTIYKPDNTPFASGTLAGTDLSIHLPALPVIGTYSLLLRTGIAQLSLDAKLETNAFVPSDGTTLSIARSAGQSTRALIAGVAGEQKALMVSELTTVPANNGLDVTVALPSGSTFRRTSATGLGATTLLPPFTTTGTHSVVLVASAGTTRSAFKVGLLAVSDSDRRGGGRGRDCESGRRGAPDVCRRRRRESRDRRYGGRAQSVVGDGHQLSVYRPDASLFAAVSCATDGTQCATNLENLPVTGTYSIIVQPSSGATGTQRLWMSHDVTGSIASGVPLGVALALPGQNARLTFAGTAGMLVALQVRAVATNPPGQGIAVRVRQPDKSLLAYTHLTGAGQTVVTPALAVTGTYTVFLEPESVKGAAIAAMEVLLDPGRALVIDGPTLDTTIAVAGGSARYLFAGMAGQNLGLGVSNLALNPTGDATVTIYKPDGLQLSAHGCAANSGGCGPNLGNLPTTGTYGIVVRPTAGSHRRIQRDAFVGSAWNTQRRRFGVGADPRSTGAQCPTGFCRDRRADAAPLLVGRRDRRRPRERNRVHQHGQRLDVRHRNHRQQSRRRLRHSGVARDRQLHGVRRSAGRGDVERDVAARRPVGGRDGNEDCAALDDGAFRCAWRFAPAERAPRPWTRAASADGGIALCTEPTNVADPASAPVDIDMWTYNVCDFDGPFAWRSNAWTKVLAGKPIFDADIVPVSTAFEQIVTNACQISVTDSAWGYTIPPNILCWTGGPLAKNRSPIRGFPETELLGIRARFQWLQCALDGRCLCGKMARGRMPKTSNMRTKPNGDLECWRFRPNARRQGRQSRQSARRLQIAA